MLCDAINVLPKAVLGWLFLAGKTACSLCHAFLFVLVVVVCIVWQFILHLHAVLYSRIVYFWVSLCLC